MNHPTRPSNEDDQNQQLRQEAIDWHVRLTSDEITPNEVQRFEEWHSRSATHEQAWEEVKNLWGGLDPLRQESLRGATPLKRERSRTTPTSPTTLHTSRRASTRRLMTLVATIALISTATLVSVNYSQWFADYSTIVGERRVITLQDGSRVELNSDTAITVNYTSQERTIVLLMGEAHFTVEPDAQRPFVVQSEGGFVKAVGTSFIVKQNSSGTRVVVLEGIVEVQHPSLAQHSTLKKDMVVSYDQNHGLKVLSSPKMELLTAWTEGHLIFEHTPLSEAIAQINQHRSGKIVLVNRKLHDYRISGIFRLDDLEDAVLAIEKTTPAEVISITPYLVLLH